mgnify:FL=1
MKKVLSILLLAIFMISCPGNTWVANPTPEADYLRCNPVESMPQMVPIPGFPGTWQVVDRCDLYPREKTAIALRVFLGEWHAVLGSSWPVKRAFKDLLITWRKDTTYHSGYTEDGRKFENVRLRGATMGPGLVYVFQNTDPRDRHERICESALAHELVHAVLWRVNGKHGDPDHLGPIYRGWTPDHSAIIQRTNEALCELGI